MRESCGHLMEYVWCHWKKRRNTETREDNVMRKPTGVRGSMALMTSEFWISSLQKCETISFCVKPPHMWHFVIDVLGNSHRPHGSRFSYFSGYKYCRFHTGLITLNASQVSMTFKHVYPGQNSSGIRPPTRHFQLLVQWAAQTLDNQLLVFFPKLVLAILLKSSIL